MGVASYFQESHEDFIRQLLDAPALEIFGMTYDRVKEEKVIGLVGYEGSCISAADGRVNFYFGDMSDAANYTGYYDLGQQVDWAKVALPYWEPPIEAWATTVGEFEKSPESDKYPLVYSTYRNKMRAHTQFGYNEWLLEIFPEPTVMVNGEELKKRNILNGDLIRVFNDRGDVVVRAVEHNGIHAGMVVLPKGWQEDQFVQGHYSNLTSRKMNPVCTNNYYYDCLCDIERYDGGR
jgi:molybdopterin-containing oxidoreductase family molybdopterin binding subunit